VAVTPFLWFHRPQERLRAFWESSSRTTLSGIRFLVFKPAGRRRSCFRLAVRAIGVVTVRTQSPASVHGRARVLVLGFISTFVRA